MPLSRADPLTWLANFGPWGWSAATPTPAASTQTTTTQYAGAIAAAPIPTPASATPAGRSQSAPRASDQRPKAGWITDDETVAASTRAAAIVYERSKSSFRYGRSAGSEPWARSVARWPDESAAIALRSTPARGLRLPARVGPSRTARRARTSIPTA